MTDGVGVLAGAAATIALLHTLLGPDHYLPFIVLSKARQWSGRKTATITFLCGLGHVIGSVGLGFAGIALGTAVFKLEALESYRGEVAAWLLIAFGFAYSVWGVRRAVRSRPHQHPHPHRDGRDDSHGHVHLGDHAHVHNSRSRSLTPWVLFTIFVFGPCEPLIPLIMYPAAEGTLADVVTVAVVFGVTTIATMLAVVFASSRGLARLSLGRFERYSHAAAGLTILASGGAIKLLGL